jgi:omega-amidase
MRNLKVTLIQSGLHWHNHEANLAMFEEKIWQIEEDTDIIVLPEMFNTGFSMKVEELAEPMNFRTFKWMKQMASQKDCAVTGSFIVKERSGFYNRLIWMFPDGSFKQYDKKHLFRMANEDDYFEPGEEALIVEYKGWKIMPLVCYDLRFPVWSRNRSKGDDLSYDLLLYVANWPAARVNAWDTLLGARAIENLCYTVGVNRTLPDGNGVPYNGHSGVYSGKGEQLYFAGEEEKMHTIELDAEALKHFRQKFPAYKDADSFTIQS